MAEILDVLKSAKYISKIDVRLSYQHIPMDERSKDKRVFAALGKEMYQHKQMPFGLSSVPATFQRLIHN